MAGFACTVLVANRRRDQSLGDDLEAPKANNLHRRRKRSGMPNGEGFHPRGTPVDLGTAIDSGSGIRKALLEELVVQPDGDHEHVGLAVQLSAGMLSAEGQQKGPTKLWRSPALGR